MIGYVISAVMSYLHMSSFDDTPDQVIVPEYTCLEDDSARAVILQKISQHVVNEHVDLATVFKDSHLSAMSEDEEAASTVYDYTCEVLSLGLFFLNFKDAVREGDGQVGLKPKHIYLVLL